VPAPHPPEFRHRAVALARGRAKPIADLATDLRISASCLRNWLAQAEVEESGSETRLSSAEKKELAQLRRDKRRLEMEVEILKRAAAYFARENVLPN
jgi:transposase